MITKAEQAQLRSDLFRHLDGIVTIPTAWTLHEKGLTAHLLAEKSASLQSLTEQFPANEGYLNVALRVLASQGWLQMEEDAANDSITYTVLPAGEVAFRHLDIYEDSMQLMRFSEQFHPRRFEQKPFLKLEQIFNRFRENYGLPKPGNDTEQRVFAQMLKHIEGIIAGPTIVHLGMSGMFHKYFMEANFKPEEFHADHQSFERLLNIFVHFDWFSKQGDVYQFTDKGLFFARRASAYGVTVSYIPTLRKLDELIFGNPRILKEASTEDKEAHVDRAMNVWGSGGAHANYFKVVDKIVIDLFNKPIEEQPKGILDMGCGNGAFLQHLYYLIEQHTLRGTMLDEHPLFLVGADYNEDALRISRANLIQADIWAKVVWGDIGRPDLLADQLMEQYGIALSDLLNVRTFLDHNRIWKEPANPKADRISQSTGAFAYEGRRIPNRLVEDSLVEHLAAWKPFVEKFGLLIIELHTVDPTLVADNLGNTGATAYDATHGYSDQYILEAHIFSQLAKEAGLPPAEQFSKRFPDSDLATVTINLLRAK